MTDKKKDQPKKAILAAGGTGGHLFPALALAEELSKDGWKIMIVTDARGAEYQGKYQHYDFQVVSSSTVKSGLTGKFKTLASLGKGTMQSAKLLNKFKPDVVVGFGGYPCFPPLFTAQITRIPTVLHEQNAVLGKANKMLAASATTIALSLPNTKGVSNHKKFNAKAVVTGNPVRPEIVAKQNAAYQTPDDNGPFRIFVMGGSQGASIFSEIIPAAIAKLPDSLKNRLVISQQCRPEDLNDVQKIYDDLGVKSELKSFFTDVPDQLEKCHLFIGRSGASTVADVSIVGRPAIYVPLKHADMQQKLNADVVADIGGAWVMMQEDFTASALAAQIEQHATNPDTLETAAKNAAKAGQPNAARNLANTVKKAAL